jgi:hypothetical protein
VPAASRQIFAYSGVLNPQPGRRTSVALIDHAIGLAGAEGPARVCAHLTRTARQRRLGIAQPGKLRWGMPAGIRARR